MSKRTYKTKNGKIIDYEAFVSKNQREIAAGNTNYNARGDKVGPGGKVVETAESRAKAYYTDNPKAVKKVSIKETSTNKPFEAVKDLSETQAPEETPSPKKAEPKKATKKKAPKEIIKPNTNTGTKNEDQTTSEEDTD